MGYFFHLQNYSMKPDSQNKFKPTCRMVKTNQHSMILIDAARYRKSYPAYRFTVVKGEMHPNFGQVYLLVTDMLN